MTILVKVPDAKKLFDQGNEEKSALNDYLNEYKKKEEKRNRDKNKRPDERGKLNSKWKPKDLGKKSVLVIGENGPGDEILTAACLPELQSTCGHVLWRCNPKLKSLFQRSFPGVEFILADDLNIKVDGTIYSWELIGRFRCTPAMFKWTISGEFESYLETGFTRETLVARYRSGSLPLVGLAWRSEGGGQGKTCDLKSVAGWSKFFDELRGRVRFVSLQHGETQDDINFIRWKYGVEIYQDQRIDTWSDLDTVAAQVAALDYVVSISTTVIHFAGALGVPSWVLLKNEPYPHWKAGNHVCPWYPTVRPVRQKNIDEWDSSLEQVANELTTKIK